MQVMTRTLQFRPPMKYYRELSVRRESNHRSILCALRQRKLAVLKISLEPTMTKNQKVQRTVGTASRSC
jgi:hypothetical protein